MSRHKKIAIFNIDAYGELLPTLPVTSALVASGHTVDYLVPDGFTRPLVERTGATFHPCGEGFDPATRYLQNPDMSLPPAALARASLVRKGYQMLPHFLAYCEAEKPDLIAFNRSCLTAKICADRMGIPSAMMHPAYCGMQLIPGLTPVYDVTCDLEHEVPFEALTGGMSGERPESPEAMARLFDDHDTTNIVFMSKEFHPGSELFGEEYHFVGPQIPEGTPPSKRNDILYVSLGTIYCIGRKAIFQSCIDAFAQSRHPVVISVGPGYTAADFSPLPGNVTIAQHVDQMDALSRAFAFISHGGMGSVQEAVWCGVPTVIVSRPVFDQITSAHRVEELQCGVALSGDRDPSAEELAHAVELVSTSQAIRDGSSRQQDHARRAGGIPAAEALICAL